MVFQFLQKTLYIYIYISNQNDKSLETEILPHIIAVLANTWSVHNQAQKPKMSEDNGHEKLKGTRLCTL